MIDKQITTKTIQMFKNKLYVKYTSRNDQVSTRSRSIIYNQRRYTGDPKEDLPLQNFLNRLVKVSM